MKVGFQDLHNSKKQDIKTRLSLILGNALGGLLVTLMCMAVLCFGFPDSGQHALKTKIFIALCVSHVLRLIENIYSRRRLKEKSANIQNMRIRATLGVFVNSAIWASFSLLVVPDMEMFELTVCAIILSALAGGTITILAPSTLLSCFYMTALLVPYASVVYFSEIEQFKYLSFLAVFFWIAMMASALKVGRALTEMLLVKNQNTSMLKQMEVEKREIERVNQDLKIANEKLDNYTLTLEDEVKRRTSQIYHLSNIDPLTGLSNRSAFNKILKEKLKVAKEAELAYALLFIDLNGFKDINDNFGHKTGDAVLSEIARRLVSLEELSDIEQSKHGSAMCRWGGDEFLILARYESTACAKTLASTIQTRINEQMTVSLNKMSVGASIGIAKFPADSASPNELIQFADIAMYHHKALAQGDAIEFSHALFKQFQYEQSLRDGLKNALNKGQFYLVFHPIIDISKNHIWAFEALLRWQREDLHISPNDFIPIAEQSGHIIEIGAWVLQEACMQAAKWDSLESIAVSVNVSSLQLQDHRFKEYVEIALESSGLDANRLHLEITESVILETDNVVIEQLDYLAAKGIHISIDDFGTGYSSLNQLQNMKFDVIKIDRSFLQSLNEKDCAIISATKFIADNFKASVVAEGIETEHELSVLKTLGIKYIQGFYFAKPMLPDELNEWTKQRLLTL